MLKPELTTDQLDGLHAVVHAARDGSAQVKVDKKALTTLLLDYGKALALLEKWTLLHE